MHLPRYQSTLTGDHLEVHCFCDAAKQAYGAVLYVRSIVADAAFCDLVFAKSRVSPIKSQNLTIPKLELTSLALPCRMTKFVGKELNLQDVPTFLWTDSQCSIQWVHNNATSPIYVGNRVRLVRSHEDVNIRYVNTEDNPADMLTRDKTTFAELAQSTLWWHGPMYLRQLSAEWPQMPDIGTEPPEPDQWPEASEAFATCAQGRENQLDPSRFSSHPKLIRVAAWVYRFVRNARIKGMPHAAPRIKGPLTGPEIHWARRLLILEAQSGLHGMVSRNSRASINRQLGLFLDDTGIIRCSGRLDYSDLPYESKYPVTLPKGAPLNYLLIYDAHCRLGHAGLSHVLAELRQEFWIIIARQQIKTVLRGCSICRREKGGPFQTPPAAPLPSMRAQESESFAHTGLDYLGPLYIRQPQGGPFKAWICLFTCAVTRAIHLEVVQDMSSHQFLLALRRFMATFGKPNIIVCDNAKTFRTARGVVDKLFAEATRSSEVQNHASTLGISWKSVIEMAPWMGGFYERMVGLVKQKLRCTIERKLLSLVELQTVCAEITGILNSRPLTYCEEDVGYQVLTPNHLITRTRNKYPVVATDDRDDEFIDRPSTQTELITHWKRIQAILNQFWLTWHKEYLVALRSKLWIPQTRGAEGEPPKIGAVVQVYEHLLPRNRWNLGRITCLNTSFDGKTRSAKVQLANGATVQRPLKLLYPLEIPEGRQELPQSPIPKGNTPTVPAAEPPKQRTQRTAARLARARWNQATEESSDEDH